MKQHTKPCRECPFARATKSKGYTGGAPPEHFAIAVHSDQPLPCHKRVDYGRKDWRADFQSKPEGRYCAGALIATSNLCKMSRDRNRPVLPADRVTVYATLPEFIDANRPASGVHSWPDRLDNDGAVQELRARFRMPPLAADEGEE